MSLIITGATIIDGVAERPIVGRSIWLKGSRIEAIGPRDEIGQPSNAKHVDASGKFIIPGLMNANVHLFMAITLERLARHTGHYDEIIAESAQIALKSGLTTVFDTMGLRRPLMVVRDRINVGETPGSRFFCAGWIVGFDGLFSGDFNPKAAEVASSTFTRRINATCAENVGRHLMWLTPEGVAREVRAYIAKGIDFVKYGSNEHFPASAGAFLAFSLRQQTAIVEEAHRAGITAQAHAMSVEGLRVAVEAGCDLVTHCNITGRTPIPPDTLEMMAERKIGAVVFPWTEKGLEWIRENVTDAEWMTWHNTDINARNLIQSGAPLLLANDGCILPPEVTTDPWLAKSWSSAPEEVSLINLATGHFAWFRAMEEKGCPPMEMLRAATKNIAVAYGKDKDLGTLERGKLADLIILDKNPLQSVENYRSIHMVIKDGVVVDREALPIKPILTKPLEPPTEEELAYIPAIDSGPRLPMCPMCMCR
jgi:imidazolonepropionase-like amidohydrolase